jgi:cation diffusion facilitator family transporter
MGTPSKRLGYIEGWLSCGLNIILFAVKYWAGVKYNSVAVRADAWHTLSDTLTSVIVILGFLWAAKKPDREHPYGHGRAEAIGAVVIATLLAVVGVGFLKESIQLLGSRQASAFGPVVITIFVVSAVLKEAMAKFSLWAGKKLNSNALRADGWHHRSDAVASLVIAAGALFGVSLWWADGVMGIGVSLLILYAAYGILKGSMGTLLGERSCPIVESEINRIVKAIAPRASALHHLHIHKYGDHAEITFHINLPDDLSLTESHQITRLIEAKIRETMNMEATIHAEPLGEAADHEEGH